MNTWEMYNRLPGTSFLIGWEASNPLSHWLLLVSKQPTFSLAVSKQPTFSLAGKQATHFLIGCKQATLFLIGSEKMMETTFF